MRHGYNSRYSDLLYRYMVLSFVKENFPFFWQDATQLVKKSASRLLISIALTIVQRKLSSLNFSPTRHRDGLMVERLDMT